METRIETKVCSRCGELKSLNEFYIRTDRNKPFAWCKKCNSIASSESGRHSKEFSRRGWKNNYLIKNYGITLEDFEELIWEQDNRCAICFDVLSDSGKYTVVDHNHKTHQIRGILCFHCNLALGHFRDNIINLKNAITYLGN